MYGKINREIIVTFGLFFFFSGMIYMAFPLHPLVRFFPLLVCIPVLVIVLLQLCACFNARIDFVLSKYFKKEPLTQTTRKTVSFKSELLLFFWLILLYLVFNALGIFLSSMLFLILFLKLTSKQPWKTTGGIILGIGGFVFLIFSLLLEMDLFDGWLIKNIII